MKIIKMVKLDHFALLLIAVIVSIRVLLIMLGVPPTNSDEGTMAIMAINIAYRGEFPLMYYGQDYMGVLEAYLGAFFYIVSGGPSIIALRLGVLVFITLFLFCLYQIASLLYSKGLGLLTLIFFLVGSASTFMRQTIATGGTSQSLFFGSLAFLLAVWLGLTAQSDIRLRDRATRKQALLRCGAFILWGVAVGLGFYSDMIVAPFLAMAGLLLILTSWRDLLFGRVILVAAGLLLGSLPLILYYSSKGISPFGILFNLTEGSYTRAPDTWEGIMHNIGQTLDISIPTATGNPFCPMMEVAVWGPNTSPSLACTLARGSWGIGYVIAVIVALACVCWGFTRLRSLRTESSFEVFHSSIVRQIARFCLIGAVVLTLVVYTRSSGPVDQPSFHARYIVPIWIATPVLLAPWWELAKGLNIQALWATLGRIATRIMLVVVWLILFIGTVMTFMNVPVALAITQERQNLIQNLQNIGVEAIYSDYWICNDIIVASREEIICAVLDAPVLELAHNRVPHYLEQVLAEPEATFVFREDHKQLQVIECQIIRAAPQAYQRYEFGEYVVYQPLLGKEQQPIDMRRVVLPDGIRTWRPHC